MNYFIYAFSLAVFFQSSVAADEQFHSHQSHQYDRDIRCCFTKKQLNQHIVIKLESDTQNIAKINIITPQSKIIGVNMSDTNYIYPPIKQGVYAYGPRPHKPIDSEKWDFEKYLVIFRSWRNKNGILLYERLGKPEKDKGKLVSGVYTLNIKANNDGNYKVVINTNSDSKSGTTLYWPKNGVNHIRKHGVQVITFNVAESGLIKFINH